MKLLRYRDLAPLKGIPYSRVHLSRLEKEGVFPKRVQVGPRRIGWPETEIDAYLQRRADERAA